MLTDLLVRLDNVESRDEDPRFYFVWHKRLFNVLLALLLANLCVWAAVSYLAMTRPEALTWAQTVEGKTVPLYSAEEPKYTNQAIEEWTENAMKVAYNYDFNGWESQLSQARPYFSPEAWDLFVKELDVSILKKVKDRRIQVSLAVDKAKIGGNPVTIGGVVAWTVQVPAMLSYVSASETETQQVLLEVVVKRQITYTNPKGLWITKLNESRK
jgi:intracellular multiplication protein IcmL